MKQAYTRAYHKAYRRVVIPGSRLNPSPSEDITDAMLFEEGSEFYMVEEDTADNYLQLVEE
jgi:hypothetical protein